MKIHVFTQKATKPQINDMLEAHGTYLKVAVDIERRILVGGGEFHSDCEAYLIQSGGKQELIWGADWIPETQEVRFEALINIRPKLNNPSMKILDTEVEKKVQEIVINILGNV
jgi:hypothetical protein